MIFINYYTCFIDLLESATVDPDPLSLDLSHLSAEERALIQNVMAKAKNMDATEPTPVAPSHLPMTR